ncbi:MAG: peptidylprolyl isomerase [Candidatus Omnitrophica bacterium]|nr:peptidylprolyl isomerase [Candidatus Omnitrophota bacterium]
MSKLRIVAVFAAIFTAIALAGCNAAKKPEVSGPGTSKAAAPTASSAAAKSGKVVAEIGNEKITLDDVNDMMKAVPEQYQAVAQTHKDMLLDSMINQKLLYAEASKLNFDRDPGVQKQLDDIKKEIIIKAYLKKEIEEKVKVTDEDAKKYYDANKDKFKEPEKIKVSHILVDSEAEAKDILAKLKGGADFAALAKEKSKDPSKDKGGEVGLLSKGQTVPEFEQAAFALQPGQLSGVVKTQFGYHIIKVDEKQPEKTMAYNDIKDQLKQMLLSDKQRESFEALLKDLRDKNKVTVYKDVLTPPEPKAEPKAAQPQAGAPAPAQQGQQGK